MTGERRIELLPEIFFGELLEFLAALLKGKIDKGFAAIVYQEIEDDEGRRSGFAKLFDAAGGGMNPHQEGVEGELPALRDDDFAVQDELSGGEGGEVGGQFGEIAGEGLGGFGHQFDATLIAEGETAEAVPLGLVLPLGAGGEFGGGESLHGGVCAFQR